MHELEQILAGIESDLADRAAKSDWNPGHQADIDIRIAADGSWYHQGRRFQRDSLVKLFASILRRESDEYYLVTPAEKFRIVVEDAPFVATLVEQIEDQDRQAIVFTTNIGERIAVDHDHGIRIDIDVDTQQPRPYLQMYAGLEALISRSAFYELINLAKEYERDGIGYLTVTSLGASYDLGKTDE